MLARYAIAGIAGTALLASVAFAQSPPAATDSTAPSATTTTTTTTTQSSRGDWRSSKVVGLSVYNDKNESVGSISDLLMDKSGDIKSVVIGVGGFLGVGEHLVAVPFDKVKFVNEPIAYTGAGATNTGGAANKSSTTTTGAATGTTTTTKSNPWHPDHAVFNATKDELKAMPEFKYSAE